MGVDREPRAPALLHPIAVAALAVLLLNDHALKGEWPGWWTGKLSDVAGLIVAPVAIAAVVKAVRRRWQPPVSPVAIAAVVTLVVAVGFTATKVDPTANAVGSWALGVGAWPVAVLGDLLAGRAIRPIGQVVLLLDPTDLIALPAVLIGGWLAAGLPEPRLRSTSRRFAVQFARMAVLAVMLFALAATTPAPRPTQTVTVQDRIDVSPGGGTTVRHAEVLVGEGVASSIRIEARERWPFNDPALRFHVRVAGVDESGTQSVVAVDPARCEAGCTLPVTIEIDWPAGPDHPSSSAAWELVATTDGRDGPNGYATAPSIRIDTGAERYSDVRGGWFGPLLALATLAALFLIAAGWERGIGRQSGRRPRLGSLDRLPTGSIAIAAGSVLAVVLLLFAALVPADRVDPGIGRSGGVLPSVAVAAALGIGWSLVRWRAGSRLDLVVSLAVCLIVGGSIAAIVVAAASPSFAMSGFAVGLATIALLGVGGAAAAAACHATTVRPTDAPDPDGRVFLSVTPHGVDDAWAPVTGVRVAVLVVQVALLVVLAIASTAAFSWVALVAFIHAAAVWAWWDDGSRWMRLSSVLIVIGDLGLFLTNGPTLLFGPSWSSLDRLAQVAVLIGALVGIAAPVKARRKKTDSESRPESSGPAPSVTTPDQPSTTR
jgi:hypothetical protein